MNLVDLRDYIGMHGKKKKKKKIENAELIKLTENASSGVVFLKNLINIMVYWNVRSVNRHHRYEETICMVRSSRFLHKFGTCLLQYMTYHKVEGVANHGMKTSIPHNLTNFPSYVPEGHSRAGA